MKQMDQMVVNARQNKAQAKAVAAVEYGSLEDGEPDDRAFADKARQIGCKDAETALYAPRQASFLDHALAVLDGLAIGGVLAAASGMGGGAAGGGTAALGLGGFAFGFGLGEWPHWTADLAWGPADQAYKRCLEAKTAQQGNQ